MSVLEWWRYRKQEKAYAHGLTPTMTAEGRRLAQAELAKGRKLRFPNPLKTIHIIMEKDVAIILLYNALIYTAFYDVVASIPSLFLAIYGFNDLQIGLCYIPFGVGCALASYVNGKMLDRNYKRVATQIGFTIDRKRGDDLSKFPIERARIELIWPMLSVGLAALLCYGWVLQQNAFLAWPLILQFIIGFCVNGSFNILSTLVVDLYPQSPSTATAANNLVRCFMGAGGTAIIDIMINRLGRGWCFTLIALICTVCMPMLWVSTRNGPKWREERRIRIEAKQQNGSLEETKEGHNRESSSEKQHNLANANDEKTVRIDSDNLPTLSISDQTCQPESGHEIAAPNDEKHPA